MNTVNRCKPLLGTFVEIKITANLSRDVLIGYTEKGFEIIQQIDNEMSFHNPNSELTRVNRNAAISPVCISKGLIKVIKTALFYSKLSDGNFDITVAGALVKNGSLPNHQFNRGGGGRWNDIEVSGDTIFFKRPLIIDLGGIAKGYAVDVAFEEIYRLMSGVNQYKLIVNAGGDLRMYPWADQSVHIIVPKKPFRNTIKVPMYSSSLATSSYYNNGSIVDASSNIQKTNLSYSVFSKNCIDADAQTKIAALDVALVPQESKVIIINSDGLETECGKNAPNRI